MLSDRFRASTASTLPGIRGIEHIGLTVPNLEDATEFFVNILGCEVVYTSYPPAPEGDWMTVHFDVHPQSQRKLRALRCHNGPHLELVEYTSPDQRTQIPKLSDHGAAHIAFYVDEMDTAIAYLKDKGIKVFGEKKNASGAEAGEGSTFVHFEAPWGLRLELISYPYGRLYEKEKEPMWSPLRESRRWMLVNMSPT